MKIFLIGILYLVCKFSWLCLYKIFVDIFVFYSMVINLRSSIHIARITQIIKKTIGHVNK